MAVPERPKWAWGKVKVIRVMVPFVIWAGVLLLLYGGVSFGPTARPWLQIPAAGGGLLLIIGIALRLATGLAQRHRRLGATPLGGLHSLEDFPRPSLFRPSVNAGGGLAAAGFMGTTPECSEPFKPSRLKQSRKRLPLRRFGTGATHPRNHLRASKKRRPQALRRV